jgi:hypothetical protein
LEMVSAIRLIGRLGALAALVGLVVLLAPFWVISYSPWGGLPLGAALIAGYGFFLEQRKSLATIGIYSAVVAVLPVISTTCMILGWGRGKPAISGKGWVSRGGQMVEIHPPTAADIWQWGAIIFAVFFCLTFAAFLLWKRVGRLGSDRVTADRQQHVGQ